MGGVAMEIRSGHLISCLVDRKAEQNVYVQK